MTSIALVVRIVALKIYKFNSSSNDVVQTVERLLKFGDHVPNSRHSRYDLRPIPDPLYGPVHSDYLLGHRFRALRQRVVFQLEPVYAATVQIGVEITLQHKKGRYGKLRANECSFDAGLKERLVRLQLNHYVGDTYAARVAVALQQKPVDLVRRQTGVVCHHQAINNVQQRSRWRVDIFV